MSEAAHINAVKRVDERSYSFCAVDDPEAYEFRVSYRGMPGNWATLDFKDKHTAQNFVRALERCFSAGKGQAMADLRAFIGAK